jgi:long-subunit fatty acid transport protein
MKARIVWWFAVPAVMGTALGVEVTKTGTTAASFLSIGVGARALGMGGAYVSAADDATAMYWNPSGMARMSRPQALFSHTRWIFDVRLGYAGVAVPAGRFGTIGASAVFLTMDEMERTTIQEPEGTGETFGAGSYAMGLS